MFQIRSLADETSMYNALCLTLFFGPTRLPEAQLATSNEILRTIAISRLVLDNAYIKAYRMNIGDNLVELALNFGADDVDGTVGRESIMQLLEQLQV